MYDYIIIGGGISGLYMNYLLSDKKTLLLEKNSHLGGRIYNEMFYDTIINTGARVGALHNKNLMKLINKLKIPYVRYKDNINIISDENINLKNMVLQIKKKYNSISKYQIKTLTVKEFIIKYFGKKFFEDYQRYIEYTDFFNNSIETYINLYPIVDHIPVISQKDLIKIDWNLLVDKLKNIIEKNNQIKLNYNVNNIQYENNRYIINKEFETKKLILCVTINSFNKLIKKSNINIIDFTKYIGSVPFVRIYTYHKNGHKLNIDKYNIVGGLLHKIIIESNTVLTMVETDNGRTNEWLKILNNKNEIIKKIKYEYKKIFKKIIQINDIKIIYWKDGVHYYKPGNYNLKNIINSLSNPYKNLFVCGEMCGLKQGWVEGAIDSVNRFYKKQIK